MTREIVIRSIQSERFDSIQSWYQQYYQQTRGNTPDLVRYVILWAVFNSLYNTLDLPNLNEEISGTSRRIKFANKNGHKVPKVTNRQERTKLGEIARVLATDDFIVNLIADQNRLEIIRELSTHIPPVNQRFTLNPNQQVLMEMDGANNTFILDEVRGIASLDKRVVLPDGLILFDYSPLDLNLDEQGKPFDPITFTSQLILILYTLRNNVVHGGSAALEDKQPYFTERTLAVLDFIVTYIFSHRELILS